MPKAMKPWSASDLSQAKNLGVIEFKDANGEWQVFDSLETPDRLIFGGCNAEFLESGYIERDSAESLDETLQELYAELETYYRDGAGYCTRIVCNERM